MPQKTITASDNLPALLIKRHSLEKLHFIRRYIYQFSTALKPTGRATGFKGFKKLNYIDLFSGPGLCVNQDTHEEVYGTPLIALTVDYPFKKYYFIDINDDFISALNQRITRLNNYDLLSINSLIGDCNIKVKDVIDDIDIKYSANLTIIDAFGIECKWSTIEELSSCRRMDFIILFPQGMNINRNLSFWAETGSSQLDEFFGSTKWRKIYSDSHGQASKCIRPFLDLYQLNFQKLGYNQTNNVREVLIRSQGRQKLYYLIAASRHPLGSQFWKQATDEDVSGQRRFNLRY